MTNDLTDILQGCYLLDCRLLFKLKFIERS